MLQTLIVGILSCTLLFNTINYDTTIVSDNKSQNTSVDKITATDIPKTNKKSEGKVIKLNENQRINPETTIKISFAGDCTIGTDESFPYVNSFPYQLKKQNNDYSYFFKNVKEIFENDDLTVVNLETTFTTANKKANKKFRFKGDPSYVNILKEGNIEMVNIANNHTYDYLEKGYKDTLNTLDKSQILYSGNAHVCYYYVKNTKIASIGYNGFDIKIKDTVRSDMEKAKSIADIVIVSFHWGEERNYYPNQTQIQLGRYSIDCGADIVIGHHPHVIQGIEKYKGKYIVYSLGNFCFGGNRNPSDKDTFIFQIIFTLRDKKIINANHNIIPCSISSVNYVNDYKPTILKEGERVFKRIYDYSSKLKYGIHN